jgi:hypothetical protein
MDKKGIEMVPELEDGDDGRIIGVISRWIF